MSAFGILSMILILFLGILGLNEVRKDRVRSKRVSIWPGGHIASPVRRLEPGYGVNDPGTHAWHWKCKYCGEGHKHLPGDGFDDDWSEACFPE